MSIKQKPVFVSGKIAGIVRDKVLDVRKHEQHLLHVPPAIGLGVEVLEQAERSGAQTVKVTIVETGRIYEQSIPNIKRYSAVQRRGGYEPQFICALEYWKVTNEGTVQAVNVPLPIESAPVDKWHQLPLGQ